MPTKTCCTCKLEMPISEFYKSKNREDGLDPRCKGCYRAKRSVSHKFTTYTRTRNGKTQTVTRRVDGHGLSKSTPLYRVWHSMRRRCTEVTAQNYRWYGGRGIRVDAEWQLDFLAFYEWAISSGYKEGLELDRIDPEKDYEPSNCRWVTKKQNIRNRDRWWSDELDAQLVAHASAVDLNPYEVIRIALEEYLSSR